MDAFHYGLLFAAAEHVVKSVISQLLRYRPRRILTGFVHEVPSIVAFAFLAGLGANWISDSKQNHAIEVIVALLAWFGTLFLAAAVRDELLWLRSCLVEGNAKAWKPSVFSISLASLLIALAPYVIWHNQTFFSLSQVLWGCLVVLLTYGLVLRRYLNAVPVHRLKSCKDCVADLVRFYSRHSPHDGDGLSVNPNKHRDQSSHYYLSRYYTCYEERQSSRLCSCREDDLVRRVSKEIILSEADIRTQVRAEIALVAKACELEFWVLVYIVSSNEAATNKALDVLNKSAISKWIPDYQEMRMLVVSNNALIPITSGL